MEKEVKARKRGDERKKDRRKPSAIEPTNKRTKKE